MARYLHFNRWPRVMGTLWKLSLNVHVCIVVCHWWKHRSSYLPFAPSMVKISSFTRHHISHSVPAPDEVRSYQVTLGASTHQPPPPFISLSRTSPKHNTSASSMASLNLSVRCDHTKWGEQVAVLGSWNSWDHDHITLLSTTPQQFPHWTTQLSLPQTHTETPIQYKYVIVANHRIVRWEADGIRNNRVLPSSTSQVTDIFGKLPNAPSAQPRPRREHVSRGWNDSAPNHDFSVDYQHLSSLDHLENAILRTTLEQRSWRQRLAFIRSLFTDEKVANTAQFHKSSLDHLVTVSAYLTFLASGQLRCEEDGGHHRPNHHASEAQQIERALASITRSVVHSELSDASSPSELYIPYVIRKIYPQLPSYSSQFTVSVPLTRIRDIAHRGDIPHDFKQEIKHTLQNKLHRCAGPEDLKTSERLLERINNGNFSHDLKQQFRIFHEELRAFFNASSLDERLRYLEHNQRTRPVASSASTVLGLKQGWRDTSVQLDALTNLRHGISNLDFMGLNSVSEAELPGEDIQKTRLADIELENYAFVLLAAIAKNVEAESSSTTFQWPYALTGLTRALENMFLSSICPAEARAVSSELALVTREHKKSNLMPHRALLLRTRAAVDRALRYVHNFSTAISVVYGRRVESIGKALNIDQHSISVFAEAEIRSNVAFQASRIANTCAKVCRRQLRLPPWDPLFVGTAIGRLVFLECLSDTSTSEQDPVVAVCRYADGDEDIPSNVRGVILGRPLPHLSHLGVRARQAGVVFVCAEEGDAFETVWNKRDLSNVRLVVTRVEGLAKLEEAGEQASDVTLANTERGHENVPRAVRIGFDSSVCVPVRIEKATQKATSSKSTFAGELLRLGLNSDDLFEAPDGIALPHGMFQKQLAKHSKRYKQLVSVYNNAHSVDGDTDSAADSLYEFVRATFTAEEKACETIQSCFQKGTRVMVRSSANAEDLEEMSGAGLYDSIANVDVQSTADLQEAIAQVWASLWTKRAASSRATYGVSHEQASMAVLIQKMVRSDISFVAFSKDPVTKGDNIYVEMAFGMGETLASATSDGSPYRFQVERESEQIETVSFASYAEALAPGQAGLRKRIIDYSKEGLTTNAEFRTQVVRRIARAVRFVEREFDGPQDVEGAITFEDGKLRVFIVQARPQIL